MNTDNIKRFCNEILFAGFLLRFVPGAILLTGIYAIWPINFGNAVTDSIFILSGAWGLGLAMEYVLFQNYSRKETPADTFIRHKAPLFMALNGLSLIIAPVLDVIDGIISAEFRIGEQISGDILNAWVLRVVLIAAIGGLLLFKGIRMMKKAD
jgi:hypothetical protein